MKRIGDYTTRGGKMAKQVVVLVVVIVMFSIAVLAATPDPGHDASSVGAGTFAIGNFTFPNDLLITRDLTVTRNIFVGTNLTANNNIKTFTMQFNTTGCTGDDGTHPEGTLCWNSQEHTLDVVAGTGQTFQVGQEVSLLCLNHEGYQINNGQVVYFPHSTGDQVDCHLAKADSFDTSDYVGVMTVDCPNGDICPVTFFGYVRDIDTEKWANGTKLYLSANESGNLTSDPPLSPNNIIWVANVIKSHKNNGFIVVAPSPDPADGYTQNKLWVVKNLTVGGNTSLLGNMFVTKNITSDWIMAKVNASYIQNPPWSMQIDNTTQASLISALQTDNTTQAGFISALILSNTSQGSAISALQTDNTTQAGIINTMLPKAGGAMTGNVTFSTGDGIGLNSSNGLRISANATCIIMTGSTITFAVC